MIIDPTFSGPIRRELMEWFDHGFNSRVFQIRFDETNAEFITINDQIIIIDVRQHIMDPTVIN